MKGRNGIGQMKRMRGVFACILIFSLVFLFGCSGNETASGEATGERDLPTMEITEEMFVTQINDIYLNSEEYMNQNIKLQGYYLTVEYNGTIYSNVVRNGPGCCTNDDLAGFEFRWDGEMPEENDWIEVVGTLVWVEEGGEQFLCLNLSSLTVLEERGLERVTH